MQLEHTTLERIKAFLAALEAHHGNGVSRAELVGLANTDTRILIDNGPSAALGPPLVVVERTGEPDEFDKLTRRQAEVARLVAQGLRNQEIADELFISIATVKDHVHAILRTLHLTNRSEIAGLYLR